MSSLPRGRSRITGSLALACVGLLGVIYLEAGEQPLPRAAQSMPSGAAGGTPVADPDVELDFSMPAPGAYPEIGARPLFSPTRRPLPAEAAAVSEEAAGQEKQFLLRGTAISGHSRVALIERRATGELLRAHEGQTVGGWRVAAITPRTVVLRSGEDEDVLEVEADAAPPVTAGSLETPGLDAADPGGEEPVVESEGDLPDPSENQAAASPPER